jgi:hypothetical protein
MKYTFTLLFLIILKINILAQQHADCTSAFWVDSIKAWHFQGANGIGKERDADFILCFANGTNAGNAEENSTWLRFSIEEKGKLLFAIAPDSLNDDYDFVLFLLPNGDCSSKKIVRCMAAGDSQGSKSPCMGMTGLHKRQTDTSADAGCSDVGDNNWLAPVRVKKGEQYALVISNVTQPYNGFSIYFSGSCQLAKAPNN